MLIQGSVSVPANSEVSNVLSGSQYEFLPFPAMIEFGMVASAAGLVANVSSGTDILMQEGMISTQNRYPVYPDDYPLNDVARAGERLVMRVRNTTAGALTFFYAAKITPV